MALETIRAARVVECPAVTVPFTRVPVVGGYKPRLRLTALEAVNSLAEVVAAACKTHPVVRVFGVYRGLARVALKAIQPPGEVVGVTFCALPIFLEDFRLVFAADQFALAAAHLASFVVRCAVLAPPAVALGIGAVRRAGSVSGPGAGSRA